MDTAAIIILAVLGFFALLAFFGFLMNRRRSRASEGQFHVELERANRDLAAAHAADNGWDPVRLHEAARQAFTQQRAGQVNSLELVQVIDPPGKDQDKAVFAVGTDNGTFRLTMGRQGDDWHFESVG